MISQLSDIEDFTTDELRKEIHRREEANRAGKCWYCKQNLAAHTCRYAAKSPCPGWTVEPPQFVQTEDCMARPEEYWQVSARNPVTGKCVLANADTAAEATENVIKQIAYIL